MKLVKKVNHRIMALLCLVVILQTLLWIGAIITGALTINGGILLITLIFSLICTVGVLVLRLTNFFTKDFIAFYNSLNSYEKAALDSTLASIPKNQNTIFMDQYLVNITFIVIKAIPYQNIVRVDNQGSKLIVYGKTPKETVALAQTKEIPIVFMLAELQRKNPGIIVR